MEISLTLGLPIHNHMHFIIHLFDGWNWVQAQYSGQLLISAKVWMKVTKNHTLTLNFVEKKSYTCKELIDLQSRTIYVDKPFNFKMGKWVYLGFKFKQSREWIAKIYFRRPCKYCASR